jgi:hypothetical protein
VKKSVLLAAVVLGSAVVSGWELLHRPLPADAAQKQTTTASVSVDEKQAHVDKHQDGHVGKDGQKDGQAKSDDSNKNSHHDGMDRDDDHDDDEDDAEND